MDHRDHVALLRPGIPTAGGVWADLGSGRGAFTLALAELLGPEGTIYSVDRDRRALSEQAHEMARRYPQTTLYALTADFTRPPEVPPLDGIIMANSLHFVRDKKPIVRKLQDLLKPDGSFILVEYNVDHGNHWVPFPLSFTTWTRLAADVGFSTTTLLGRRPSRFLHEIYSARSS